MKFNGSSKQNLFLLANVMALGVNMLLSLSPRAVAQVSGSTTSSVKLQPSTPGTSQSGNANLSGKVKAGQLEGDGSRVTNLNPAHRLGDTR